MATPATLTYRYEDPDLLHADQPGRYVLRVRDLPEDERPREKLIAHGVSHLSVQELVAVILEVGHKKEDVLSMAERIIQEYGQRAIINETSPGLLAEALDIPQNKACRIVASLELGRRFYQQRSGRPVYVRNAKQAHAYLMQMGNLSKEQFRGLYLNSRYQVIHDEVISVGSLTANIVHPREVFQPAMEHGGVAVIIAHNHPSGSLQPSYADREVTEQLQSAGQVLGIDLLDHLIITKNGYKSIKKEAL